MLLLTDRKVKLFFYLILFILLSTQITKNKNVNNNFDISLEKIEVTGLSNKNNLKVYKSLKFLLAENIFFIDKSDFYNVLKKNNLIEYFYIKKIYPNLIEVKIKQADLLAITKYEGKNFYIGSNGRLISVNQIKNYSDLPFLYSKNNYISFINLKKIIDKSDFQFYDIDSFYYFPSNRWDFKTKDGILIKLPEKNLLNALQLVYKIKSNKKIGDNKIIDLRIPN